MKKEKLGLLIVCMLLLSLILGILIGYFDRDMKLSKDMGIGFNCNKYTSRYLNMTSCNATITIPSINQTIIIDSNFDEIKIVS